MCVRGIYACAADFGWDGRKKERNTRANAQCSYVPEFDFWSSYWLTVATAWWCRVSPTRHDQQQQQQHRRPNPGARDGPTH